MPFKDFNLLERFDPINLIVLILIGWMLYNNTADIDKRLTVIESSNISQRLTDIETRLTRIEMVMLLENRLPSHCAENGDLKEKSKG